MAGALTEENGEYEAAHGLLIRANGYGMAIMRSLDDLVRNSALQQGRHGQHHGVIFLR